MPKERSFDIDTELDLRIVDFLLHQGQTLNMDKYPRHLPVDMKTIRSGRQRSGDLLRPAAERGVLPELRDLQPAAQLGGRVHAHQGKPQGHHPLRRGGVCDACRVAEQKHNTIDWAERERQLSELCDRYRRNDGHYDCLVPGSGGKDSFYASHVLKHKYGMHPLTVTWAPHIYTEWGWKNFQAWIHAGFDNFLHTPNGRTHRLLTRLAVENLFHPFQAFMLGQKSLAPKMALLHNIPLVFYGENEAEYGNPQSRHRRAPSATGAISPRRTRARSISAACRSPI